MWLVRWPTPRARMSQISAHSLMGAPRAKLECKVGERLDIPDVDYHKSRIRDVAIIGWINPDEVPLDDTGIRDWLKKLLPLDGQVPHKLTAQAFLIGVAVLGPRLMGLRQIDRDYLLNWLFKHGANDAPKPQFRDTVELEDWAAEPTNYKLFNRFAVKFSQNSDGDVEAPSVEEKDTAIGTTVSPISLCTGGDPGRAGDSNGYLAVLASGQFVQVNDGTPSWSGVRTLNKLAKGAETWNSIGSKIELGLSDGAVLHRQVYPTYCLYVRQDDGSFRRVRSFKQADEPIKNFNTDPYHSPTPRRNGPAPFLP